MGTALLTERLALRQFTDGDVEGLLALDGDPRVLRFLDRTAKSRAQIQAEVLPHLLGCYAPHPGFGCWAAEGRRDGGFVGWFGLRPVRPTAAAMVHWPDAPPGPVLAKAGLHYLRTVHLDWPDPLPGNEQGDVEYQLRRADWHPSNTLMRRTPPPG